MDLNVTTQLISSFIIGGILVGAQATIAEKANKKLAGLVLTFPSTAIVSFFFMWQVLSENRFQHALVPVPVTMGISLLFIYAYIKSFQILSSATINSKIQVLLSALISISFWALCAFSILKSQLTNIWLSLAISLVLIITMKLLLNREQLCTQPLPKLQYNWWQKLLRIVFSGGVISTTVFLAKTMGPVWGGIFSMFPAAYISSLLMYSPNYNHRFMYRAYYNAPKGIIGLLIFTFAALWTFPLFGNIGGTLIAISSSFVYSLIIYLLSKD
jgi:hypothetical protein